MLSIDANRFWDVADSLGISSPSIVEKDYWAIQLLDEVSKFSLNGYQLVFSGGTCLTKAHQDTYRMSEDIDIKLVPDGSVRKLAKNQQRELRREIRRSVSSVIELSEHFSLAEKSEARSESRYQMFLVGYPKKYEVAEGIRPHLQLELTERDLLAPSVQRSLSSLYASEMNEEPEVKSISCDRIEPIASEKFVALLRRTALHGRDNSRADDETLIRHVYDLHLIRKSMEKPERLKAMVREVIDVDQQQFGNQHREFEDDAISELRYGLSILLGQPHHQERYSELVSALVYHPEPAGWDEAIASVQFLAKYWL